jgi:hypothetical protein
MTKHYELVDSVPGNIYQQKMLRLCALSLSANVFTANMADSTQLSGVGKGYVVNRIVSFHIFKPGTE